MNTWKCITICAPWAWACTVGPKDLENRPWPIRYRGELLIHCGKSTQFFTPESLNQLSLVGCPTRFVDHHPGHIVGIVRVNGSLTAHRAREMLKGNLAAFIVGPHCHMYGSRRWFTKPVPFTGARGLFDVPETPALLEAIRTARPALWTPRGDVVRT